MAIGFLQSAQGYIIAVNNGMNSQTATRVTPLLHITWKAAGVKGL
jgi:hypothetical protein